MSYPSFQPGAVGNTQGFGNRPEVLEVAHIDTRSPTTNDTQYPVGKYWINTNQAVMSEWFLNNFFYTNGVLQANWALIGTASVEDIQGDDGNNVAPISGIVQLHGNVVANGTYVKPLYTATPGTNVENINIQLAAAEASSSVNNAGIASFSSSYFSVDSNGYVTSSGSGFNETLTGNSGGAVGASAGNINVVGTGSITAVGNPGTSTLTVEMTGLTNHALLIGAGSATITNLGPSSTSGQVLQSQGSSSDPAFSTATYPSTVTAYQLLYASNTNIVGGLTNGTTGQVLTATTGGAPSWGPGGADMTLTGNSGGAISPSAGNWNVKGTGSLTTVGSGNTLTVELTGTTNHAVQVGNGSTTLTQVGPSTTAGQILQSNGSSADPSFSTATYPATTSANQLLYSSLNNVVSGLSNGTTGQVLTATTGSAPTWQANAASLTFTPSGGSVVNPSGGNVNFTGLGSITTYGTGSTVETYLTGLTSNAIQVGAGTTTLTQLGPQNNSVLTTSNSGVPTLTSLASNGQLIIGSGSGAPAAATLTAGTGISITNAANSITISATGEFDLIKRQVFTSSGTYTPTSGMLYCDIEVVGGGGGGGGVASTSFTNIACAGGGGGGGYARGIFSASTIGSSQTITIGAAGSAGSAGANNGGNGGTTSVGSLISATGGYGGTGAAAGTSQSNPGGEQGNGTGGDFQTYGTAGFGGLGFYSSSGNPMLSGAGGSTFFGGGGVGLTVSTTGGYAGVNGASYGSGGSGAANGPSQSSRAGGSGSAGVVIITEYI